MVTEPIDGTNKAGNTRVIAMVIGNNDDRLLLDSLPSNDLSSDNQSASEISASGESVSSRGLMEFNGTRTEVINNADKIIDMAFDGAQSNIASDKGTSSHVLVPMRCDKSIGNTTIDSFRSLIFEEVDRHEGTHFTIIFSV